MQSKHVVFAALIYIFCAGAVVAAIGGQSETIQSTNTPPRATLTPIETAPSAVIPETAPTPPDIATDTISTPSTTTPNDTETSSSSNQ